MIKSRQEDENMEKQKTRNLIDIKDLSKEEIDKLIKVANDIRLIKRRN